MILTGAKICAENCIYEKGSVEIAGDKIARVLPEITKNSIATDIYNLPDNWLVFPGMIDMHIHGGYGKDVMDADPKSLDALSKMLPKEGVTAYLATTMTQSSTNITAALDCITDYCKKQEIGNGARLLGVNLEGPFISAEKCGAQPKDYILQPDLSLMKMWCDLAGDCLKIVTVAPEIEGGSEMIKYITKKGIIASVGHSNANYDETCAAISLGCKHATHLFNAMSSLNHRDPGAALALLLDANVCVELIADGIHLHPAILQMALRLKGTDKIILVSDAIEAKGLSDGEYKLAGQSVCVAAGRACTKEGVLAGSILTMDAAMRNMLQFTNCSVLDVSKMVAQNPARQLGLEKHKGSIAPMKDADIVVFDENYRVMLTLCCGKVNYISDKI